MVGSQAMRYFDLTGRKCLDTDYICTYHEYSDDVERSKNKGTFVCSYQESKEYFVLKTTGGIFEYEITDFSDSGRQLHDIILEKSLHSGIAAKPCVLLSLKESHKYKKNSPHFYKTMSDIRALRAYGVIEPDYLKQWRVFREAETYRYSHPVLEQKKDDFFKTDGVDYVYDHDSIHRSVAVEAVPAYTKYMKDGAEVNCDKQKFLSLPEHIKIYGVYEEACVLAIERSLAPIPLAMTPEQAFKYALMKVCTSITSGWFREYAWENHDKVLEFAQSTEFSFWGRFNSDLQKGLILKHIAA